MKGSSGSSVFDSQGRIISLNTFGGTYGGTNFGSGVRMRTVIEESTIAGEVLAYAAPCSGFTSRTNTNWVDYTSTGIYVDIDTSRCGFDSTPLYFTSLGGARSHWLSKGGTSIYSATTDGFRVYVKYPWGITPETAKEWDWHINWEALPNEYAYSSLCTGITNRSDWKNSTSASDTVYVTVDTSKCGFTAAPNYLTSLKGSTKHWDSIGATAIRAVDHNSFQVHVTQSGITADLANDYNWRIQWRAETNLNDSGDAIGDACTGADSTGWKQYGSSALYLDVDTSKCELPLTASFDPIAFFTLQANGPSNIGLDGLTSVYNPQPNKFRVFVQKSGTTLTPDYAENNGWRVNWHLRD
jgi:hypothetical protein